MDFTVVEQSRTTVFYHLWCTLLCTDSHASGFFHKFNSLFLVPIDRICHILPFAGWKWHVPWLKYYRWIRKMIESDLLVPVVLSPTHDSVLHAPNLNFSISHTDVSGSALTLYEAYLQSLPSQTCDTPETASIGSLPWRGAHFPAPSYSSCHARSFFMQVTLMGNSSFDPETY